MNILKAVDSDGKEITPDGSFTSGITRYLTTCLQSWPMLIPLSEVIRVHIVVPFSPEMRPHVSSLHKVIHQIPISRTTDLQHITTESCTYNSYSIMLIAFSLSQKSRSQWNSYLEALYRHRYSHYQQQGSDKAASVCSKFTDTFFFSHRTIPIQALSFRGG